MANLKLASAAKSKASSPDELYDTLPETSQDVWDMIGRQGFRPDRDESLQWWAYATQGDDKIGPKPTLSDLATAVQEFVDKKDSGKSKTNGSEPQVEKLPANSKGDKYLPGMEPVVDKEIAAAAGKYHAVKTERCDLSRQEKVAKDELAEVCHRKKALFKVDPDNTLAKIYRCGDLVIRMENKLEEKITTEIVDSED
jgi:hypothetical protein